MHCSIQYCTDNDAHYDTMLMIINCNYGFKYSSIVGAVELNNLIVNDD